MSEISTGESILTENLRTSKIKRIDIQLSVPQLGQLMNWASMARQPNCLGILELEESALHSELSSHISKDVMDAIELSLDDNHVLDLKETQSSVFDEYSLIEPSSLSNISSEVPANELDLQALGFQPFVHKALNTNLEASEKTNLGVSNLGIADLRTSNFNFTNKNLLNNPLLSHVLERTVTPVSNLGYGSEQAIDYGTAQQYIPQDAITFNEITERIWRFNDQRASLYLQERLRKAVPTEFEQIIEAINLHLEPLMKHRFGNFLVQCMLELTRYEEITHFASFLSGRIAEMSKNQFCCHVIQRLLDVSPLVIQARVAAELLDDVIGTMTSPFGTHVWQKLFHLSWSPNLPSIVTMANNAVHLDPNTDGWMTVASTQAGCATIKSFLSSSHMDNERQECVNELLAGMNTLMTQPSGSTLVPKLAVISTTRARAMTLIFSRAYEYCKHPIASTVVLCLLKLKIPSFPVRLGAAIAPYRSDLMADVHGSIVIATLQKVQGNL